MYYDSIRVLLEKKAMELNLNEDEVIMSLDLLNKISEHFDTLKLSKPEFITATIIFFILDKLERTKNFKQVAELFDIDSKNLALKVREIAILLNVPHIEEILRKGLLSENIVTSTPIKKEVKVTKAKAHAILKTELNDLELIHLLKEFKKFIEILFKDKEYLEIKLFIKLFESNLSLASYDIKKLELEKRFGQVFVHLGFEPKKGREPDKFVNLVDRFGQTEPYSLIKLGE